jgi:outer membrane protein OmpA-like peptidoglycan-associated protein
MRLLELAFTTVAILLLCSGCATTDPVSAATGVTDTPPVAPAASVATATSPERTVAPMVDERFASVAQELEQVNQRLDKIGRQIQGLEGGVTGAQQRADEAIQKAENVDQRLTRLWSKRFHQKEATSMDLYFSPDSVALTDGAQTVLALVANEMEMHPTLTVELGGYTDPRGALEYNYSLSQRRVDVVRRFLLDKGIQLARIRVASLGPITDPGVPDARKRRVTIRLFADQE